MILEHDDAGTVTRGNAPFELPAIVGVVLGLDWHVFIAVVE